MPIKDPDTNRAYMRAYMKAYRLAHAAKVRAQAYGRYHANLEISREKSRIAGKKYRERHPAKAREEARRGSKAYRLRHPERHRAQVKASRKRTMAHILAYQRTYNRVHRARVSEQQRKTRQRNPEKYQASRRRYYDDNKIEKRQASKVYRLAHPEQYREYARTKDALKRGASHNDLTHAQWLEIQAAQDHRCYYCGKRCKGKLTQDHILPVSKGGAHTLHNVIGACRSCNSKKHAGPPPKPVQPMLLTIAPARKKRKLTCSPP